MEASPSFKDPLENGMPWMVVRYQVGQACPGLASLLQEAGNAGHGIERLQTKVQTLLQIHQKAQRDIKSKGEPCWKKIAEEIEDTRPFLVGQAADMCEYVRAWSCGNKPIFLKELDDWCKSLPCRRDLPGHILGLLAKVNYAQGPEYITACVKAMLVSPESFCRAGESRLFNSSDTQVMTGKLAASI